MLFVLAIEELTRINEELIRKLAERDERIERLEKDLSVLREAIATLKHSLFGKKSERLDPDQLHLFDQGEEPALEPEPEAVEVAAHRRAPRGHGRQSFPDHLPREEIELDLPADERCCPDCGSDLRPIGEDVCERGHFVPAQLIVRRYRKKKYACPQGHCVRCPETPPSLIDRCKYEPSVYAHVVAAKYLDHVPLHRMAGIFKRHGVHLPKQTIWEMLLRVDELLAVPILKQMHEEMLCEDVLHGDETPVPVRLEDGRGTRTARVWAWTTLGAKKAIFVFTMTKERDGPIRFLGDWSGTVIADGASNFNEVVRRNDIKRAGCWAHARRKLKSALDRGARDAVRLLIPVQRLFRLERAMKRRLERRGDDWSEETLHELRRRIRSRRSARLIEQIYERVDEIALKRGTLPRSELGKALKYLVNQRDPLTRFLEDPRIPIHNNDCERALRHLVTGRKNWLVFGSPRGGEVASRLYSLMLSCRAVGVDPEAYLVDALQRISTTPNSQIASLTPWAWAAMRRDDSPQDR
ncbi:MAG: IS66 family transposase [Planctomycetota bacterium]|nr:MAG: IS66 family transposase [Planctomycetota bacterium]